jgi:hypothetical protein
VIRSNTVTFKVWMVFYHTGTSEHLFVTLFETLIVCHPFYFFSFILCHLLWFKVHVCRHIIFSCLFVSLAISFVFTLTHQLSLSIPLSHSFKICPFLCITQSKAFSDQFWRFRPNPPGVFVHSSVAPTGKYSFLVTLFSFVLILN